MMRFRIRATLPVALGMALVGALATSATAPALPARQNSAASGTPTWAAPYTKTVTMSIGWPALTGTSGLPSGATQQDNARVRYIERKLNVHFTWAFLAAGDAYAQKVALSIASGDIPDVMQVNYQQLRQLAAAGLIQDLTPTYQQYASPYIKGLYALNHNRALQMATVNGKLMAIPDTQVDYQYNLLWVRKDWLDKLHLAAPKTLADVISVARAFVKNRVGGPNTIGLMGPSGASATVTSNGGSAAATVFNGPNGFDTLFGVYHAYPGQFLNNNGMVTYGSVAPEMKSALQTLRQLYAEGLLDPQFVSRSQNDELALAENGTCGLMFGPWWMPFSTLQNSVKNDPKANWRPYIAPVDAKGILNVMGPPASATFIVVRKGYAQPDAVWRVEDADEAALRGLDPVGSNVYPGLSVIWTTWPALVQLEEANGVLSRYWHITRALKTHDASHLTSEERLWYQAVVKDKANPHPEQDLADWQQAYSLLVGTKPMADHLNQIHESYPLTMYATPTMRTRMAELNKLESQTLLGIIAGQYPLSQFDTFVHEWHALGGDRILKEIQQQIHA